MEYRYAEFISYSQRDKDRTDLDTLCSLPVIANRLGGERGRVLASPAYCHRPPVMWAVGRAARYAVSIFATD